MNDEIDFVLAKPEGWEQARLFINGNEVMEGEYIVLHHLKENSVVVELPTTIARVLRMELENPGFQDVKASPNFGSPVNQVDGKFNWQITLSRGERGRVWLDLESPDIDLPWKLTCLVMAANLLDEVESIMVGSVAFPPGVAGGILMYRESPHKSSRRISLVYKQDSQLMYYPIRMKATPITGLNDGDLQVTCIPPNTWEFWGENNNGTFELDFSGTSFITGATLPGKVISTSIPEEFKELLIDGKPFSQEIVLFRDVPRDFELTFHEHNPLKGSQIFLKLIPVSGLDQSNLVVTTTSTHEWVAQANSKSGTFGVEIELRFGASPHYGYRFGILKVLSPNLEDEVDVLIDGKPPVEGMKFIHGTSYLLTLWPKKGSPLEGHALQLHCADLEGFNPGDLKCEPGFDLPQTSNYGWVLTPLQGFGKFQLSLTGEGMTKALELPVSRLGQDDISKFFEVRFDGKTLPDGQQALATRYGRHTITLMPKSGAPEGDVRLNWGTENPGLGVEVTPPIGVAQTVDRILGATWSLACLGEEGEFSVKAELEGSPLPALELPVSLSAGQYIMRFRALGISQPLPPKSTVGAELFPGGGWGLTPSVLVTTQGGVPVSGVKVEFIAPDHPIGYGTTGDAGTTGSSVPVKYYPKEERLIEFLARTTEPTGRVSMIRLLVKLVPSS
ncbi:hypothetical protein OH720_14745 [Pseudomonas sp. WJP1]|uniref:hypothetical protein n=1 Tax=Pseudomonas sp. WJP1 TaxID=2986947 RepID=UPI002349166D|nr:hypothetical protein [Pseudomonas sp. WJP1]WCM54203.1 hypothetical protein OH720_14745 [Pseudomonas sp. WJP1]